MIQSLLLIIIDANTFTDGYMFKKMGRLSGLLLMMLSISILGVSAYVYQQSQLSVTQSVKEIATFTLTGSELGSINEGQSLTYTKVEIEELGDAIDIHTTIHPVYLHFSSNLASMSTNYSNYEITVIYSVVPGGGTGIVNNTACTLSIGSPTGVITLDASGTWKFDLVVNTTAKSVDADTPTSVTLTATAESS
jgi:hypothetical protein